MREDVRCLSVELSLSLMYSVALNTRVGSKGAGNLFKPQVPHFQIREHQ